MALKPISFRRVEEETNNMYEAVVILSQRAKKVLQERMVDQAFPEYEEEAFGVFDEMPKENPEEYEEQEKPTSVAINDMLEGKLKWHRVEGIEEKS